jgi:hypothetical protein
LASSTSSSQVALLGAAKRALGAWPQADRGRPRCPLGLITKGLAEWEIHLTVAPDRRAAMNCWRWDAGIGRANR